MEETYSRSAAKGQSFGGISCYGEPKGADSWFYRENMYKMQKALYNGRRRKKQG